MDGISDELTCSVCLEMFSDPYLLPCGHSFCLECVHRLRNSMDFKCPDCRRDCVNLRDMVKNFKLANIVEAYKTGKSSRPPMPIQTIETYLIYGVGLLIFLVIYLAFQRIADMTKVEPLDYTIRTPVTNQKDYDETTHGGHLLTDLVHGIISLVRSVACWCLWAIISSLAMVWNSMWYLISSLYFVIYAFLCLVSSSLFSAIAKVCHFFLTLFNLIVYLCGIATLFWVLLYFLSTH